MQAGAAIDDGDAQSDRDGLAIRRSPTEARNQDSVLPTREKPWNARLKAFRVFLFKLIS